MDDVGTASPKKETEPDKKELSSETNKIRDKINLINKMDVNSFVDVGNTVRKTDNQFMKPQDLVFSRGLTKDKLPIFSFSVNNQISTERVYFDKELLRKVEKIIDKIIKEQENQVTADNIITDLLGKELSVYGSRNFNFVIVKIGIIPIEITISEARALQRLIFRTLVDSK